MMRLTTSRTGGRSGFTLIELTVVLAVIVTLALILTPSIANLINDARTARARADCQTIASAVVQFYRDTGFFPMYRTSQAGGPGLPDSRLMVLYSRGNVPLEDQQSQWTIGPGGPLADQLLANVPGYALRTPAVQNGWSGPYLSSELASDPWGNRYVVNVGLLDTTPGPTNGQGRPKSAVWVLSPGPNGVIDTPFQQPLLSALIAGDDIGIRIQ